MSIYPLMLLKMGSANVARSQRQTKVKHLTMLIELCPLTKVELAACGGHIDI